MTHKFYRVYGVFTTSIGLKMTMNREYDSEGGVILPVENKLLSIVHLLLKLTKNIHFTLFAKNRAVVFLLVVKMAQARFTLIR